jgi:hypothetical protein
VDKRARPAWAVDKVRGVVQRHGTGKTRVSARRPGTRALRTARLSAAGIMSGPLTKATPSDVPPLYLHETSVNGI